MISFDAKLSFSTNMFSFFCLVKSSRRIDFLQKVANEKEIDKHYENPERHNVMAVWNQCAEEGLFSTWRHTMKHKVTKSSVQCTHIFPVQFSYLADS